MEKGNNIGGFFFGFSLQGVGGSVDNLGTKDLCGVALDALADILGKVNDGSKGVG